MSGGAVVAVGGGDVAITPVGILCVIGSIAAFSTYVLVSDRVLVRTDSLTAATWTALGAAIGVTFARFVQGVLEAPSGPALASMFANGVATAAAFTLFFVVLGRIGATRTAIVMALEAVIGIALSRDLPRRVGEAHRRDRWCGDPRGRRARRPRDAPADRGERGHCLAVMQSS